LPNRATQYRCSSRPVQTQSGSFNVNRCGLGCTRHSRRGFLFAPTKLVSGDMTMKNKIGVDFLAPTSNSHLHQRRAALSRRAPAPRAGLARSLH
jgi:hypothetical protein